jgi:NitT/TauT family transport system permease protein
MMNTASGPLRPLRIARRALGILLAIALWEFFARSGMFSKAVTPPFEAVLAAFWSSLADGTLFKHAGATLLRLFAGLAIAVAVAMPLALLMGRYPLWERMLRGPLAMVLPIPSLAWVPLVVLWFGIGNTATIVVVVYASFFPLLYNVWMGVRAVNPLWLRAAGAMNAGRGRMLTSIILPAAMPYIITGLRLAFGRGWIAVIGGELLSGPEWGLGKVIFDAKEYLNADVMLAALLSIGLLGLLFERVVFQRLESATVERWGMNAGRN